MASKVDKARHSGVGFTLAELLVVVLILGVLAAGVVLAVQSIG